MLRYCSCGTVNSDNDVQSIDGSLTRLEEARASARLDAVANAIGCVAPPGDFVALSEWSRCPLPGLTVHGIHVSVPVIDAMAAVLTAAHEWPAQRTRNIPAADVRVSSAQWDAQVRKTVEHARLTLGVDSEIGIAAQLRELVLYESGGHGVKAVASVSRGSMGTLLVVLLSVFIGGEIMVHEPVISSDPCAETSTRTRNDPGANPFAVRCGVFYRDCAFEVDVVQQGYLLCLEYDLMVDGAAPLPAYGANHEAYYRLQDVLVEFFARDLDKGHARYDDLREGYVKPPIPRKLVHILKRKQQRLLVGNDASVAQSLAKFCEDSRGAFRLYLYWPSSCECSTMRGRGEYSSEDGSCHVRRSSREGILPVGGATSNSASSEAIRSFWLDTPILN